MRQLALAALAALAGCYSPPSSTAACTLLCSRECPDDLSCVNGYCVAKGARCEPSFTKVSAGNGFACALDEHERRWCWGANDQHQLDTSSRTTLAYATLVDTTPWDTISSGGDHACGLRGGALYCWGGNDRQQVSGTISGDVDDPLRIEAPNRAVWTTVVAGYANTCGIAGGTVYCWGANQRGQVGAGTADVGAPTQVGSLVDATTVAVGREHACALSPSVGLQCWGYNQYGQLGDGSPLGSTTPSPPVTVALTSVTEVAVAGLSTCAIANAQLYCWGRSSGGVLGDPAIAIVDSCIGATSTPIVATTLEGWTRLSASRTQLCGVRDGELYCWGATPSGHGVGVWGQQGFVKVSDGVSQVSVGWNTNVDDAGNEADDLDVACFIRGGAIECWGDNRFGQLAQGAASMATVPTEIVGNHAWATLVAGDSHVCGIDTEAFRSAGAATRAGRSPAWRPARPRCRATEP